MPRHGTSNESSPSTSASDASLYASAWHRIAGRIPLAAIAGVLWVVAACGDTELPGARAIPADIEASAPVSSLDEARIATVAAALATSTPCSVLSSDSCPREARACHPAATGLATCVAEGSQPRGASCSTPGVAGACQVGAVCDIAAGPAQCLALCAVGAPNSCAQGVCVASPIYRGFGVCVASSAAGVAVSQPIIAAQGGNLVHPAGARLTIPPGALPADAVVSLRDAGPARPGVDPALQVLSHNFVVSMRGVERCTRAILSLEPRDNVAGQPDGPVDRENLLVGAVDTDGQRKLFRPGLVTAETGGIATTVDLCPKAGSFANFGTVAISAHVAGVHGVDYTGVPTILRVPYYSQDNLPWCVPTSLAMTMNQFDDLEGIVSNYQLAGADGQGATDGNSYVGILNSMGVSPSIYAYVKWDADLIPSAPFNNYVKYVLSGNYPQYTRGLGMSSTTTSHAFVGVGANNQNIWLHDPSGAFAGDDDIAIKLTWAQFKATAIDAASSTELRTLYFNKPLRPASERTGSLVLAEGSGSSFVYKSDANVVLSTWQWDGSFWQNGYIWDDPLGILPQDGVFGNRFPRDGTTLPGKFAYKTSVANVTGAPRTYEVWIFLENALGTVLESKVVNLDVPAYSWKGHVVSGELDDFVIASDGDYELAFELWEGGAWQDVKRVGFHVGTGPLAIP